MKSNLHQKKHSPACDRNQLSIIKVLAQHFPSKCEVLELASGTGQHADFFTSEQPGWKWQPSDVDPESLLSIEAYRQDSKNRNFLAPISLSTQASVWTLGTFDAALCCNMIHISPWEACIGMFYHLKQHLNSDGTFVLYGPFLRKEIPTTASNLNFDHSLKERNPSWGLRDMDNVEEVASSNNFEVSQTYEMPANNLAVVFQKKVKCSP